MSRRKIEVGQYYFNDPRREQRQIVKIIAGPDRDGWYTILVLDYESEFPGVFKACHIPNIFQLGRKVRRKRVEAIKRKMIEKGLDAFRKLQLDIQPF